MARRPTNPHFLPYLGHGRESFKVSPKSSSSRPRWGRGRRSCITHRSARSNGAPRWSAPVPNPCRFITVECSNRAFHPSSTRGASTSSKKRTRSWSPDLTTHSSRPPLPFFGRYEMRILEVLVSHRSASVHFSSQKLDCSMVLEQQPTGRPQAKLARRYPTIQVHPNVLFVDSGSVLTSAGAAAGLDLCLHLVRRDFGSNVAADTARGTVMSLERSGGQAQFINRLPATPESGGLAPLLSWIEEHCHEDLALTDIAANASLSVRTLNRRFRTSSESRR